MPEQKKLTMAMQQAKDKPKIENLIPGYLPDDKIELALEFVAWMKSNKMNPAHSGSFNVWKANYNGKNICRSLSCAWMYSI